ncbi:MAG: metallophosphoesterase [Planctomycetes bacterium]|nr:metallophosphoesterase [Planctomycetota bacterium]
MHRIYPRVCLALFASTGLVAQSWSFVSIPDFQNNDIASLADPASQFPGNPTLPAGFVALDPAWDSCTAAYDDAVNWIVSRLALEQPDFVSVAGDLVMGHWEYSSDGRNVFGPLSNDTQIQAAVGRAADFYYDHWLGRFDPARNTHLAAALQSLQQPLVPMTVHALVGDHELGDNNWPTGGARSRMVPTYKEAFARWFTQVPAGAATGAPRYVSRPVGTVYENTAYAFQHNNVLIVMIDEFRQDDPFTNLGANGSVLPTLDNGLPGTTTDDQLAWLDGVLAAGRANPTVDWIIVQGHMPVLRPVRVRNSSNLSVRDQNGAVEYNTLLWQTLSQYEVDLYFCGEVHDITLSRYGGVTQLVHGALIGNHSPINYLRIDVHANTLELTSKQINVQLATGNMWQTGSNRPRADFDISAANRTAGYQTAGYAELTRQPGGGSWVTQATGTLAPYGTFVNGGPTPTEYLVDLDFDQLSGGVFDNAGSTGPLNDGAPTGNVTQSSGVFGQAVTLGGASGDQVLAGTIPLLGTQERTVSVWAKTTAASGLVTPLAFGTNPGVGTKWDMDIDCSNGGTLELGISGGRTTGSGPALNDGQWHMLTTVLPAGATNLNQVRLFVDGALAYTGSGSATVNTSSGPVVIGRSANPQTQIQFFPGSVDDAVIWSAAFTDAQVKSLHDVAVTPSLHYAAGDFELLLDVYRQNESEATIAGRVWRRATGMVGPGGLTALANGGYQLVFDTATGAGVATPAAAFATTGVGCPSPVGLPALSAPQLPVLGATLEVEMSNVSPTGLPFMVVGYAATAPFPISLLGLSNDPTCLFSVSLDAFVGPLVLVGSTASMSLSIPASSALAGAQLHFQGTQLELTTGFWSLSDRGTATLGF